MITSISINNFKSVRQLSFDLSKVNVVIGENGCGKTNILEAIAFASASQGYMVQETLGRKMRYVPADFMIPAFADIDDDITNKIITISLSTNSGCPLVTRAIYNPQKKEWINDNSSLEKENVLQTLKLIYDNQPDLFSNLADTNNQDLIKAIKDGKVDRVLNIIPDVFGEMQKSLHNWSELNSFTIYCPEESKLRRFSDDTAAYPLGRNGEGLFQYLKEISNGEKKAVMKQIISQMSLLDWFDGTSIPNDLLSNEYRLMIGDKYLKDTLHYFDQRSSNEGFLFLLFYMTLFSSPDTPPFFAIDNIEASFNPKLCTKLIQVITDLAKKNRKQVIITTHNPYILNGLDLSDDAQRLFVARRNRDGHTQIKRIPFVDNLNMHLSEVWMKGMIGGLPDNF